MAMNDIMEHSPQTESIEYRGFTIEAQVFDPKSDRRLGVVFDKEGNVLNANKKGGVVPSFSVKEAFDCGKFWVEKHLLAKVDFLAPSRIEFTDQDTIRIVNPNHNPAKVLYEGDSIADAREFLTKYRRKAKEFVYEYEYPMKEETTDEAHN